jgi:hypothetical protein
VCVNGTAQWGSAAPAWAEAVEVKRAPDPTEIGDEGCQYEGATRIIFNGDGTMTVWSKNTTTKPNDGCGSLDELSSATGAVVDVPDGSIIYVKSIDVDANPALNKEIPSKGIGGPSGKELPLGTYETKYEGLPMGSGDTYTHEVSMKYSDKFIGIGNAWIEGEAAGTVTVYADRSIVLTGDLLTEDDDNDLLGLMAGGSIEIYNPVMETLKAVVNPSASGSYLWSQPGDDQRVRATGTNVWPTDYQGDTDVLRIEAGIIAGNGSFRLQNWKIGSTTGGPAPLGEVQLFGSLAQNFRGVLGWDSGESAAPSLLSGYKKSFTYNGNLTKKRPLLFSPIGNGEWSIWWQEKVDPPKVVKT